MRKLLSVLSYTLQGGVRGGLLFLLFFASVSAIYASDTQVDGIWYDFDNSTKTASVTYKGSNNNSYADEYSGAVVIPETVTYNGTTYSVTSIGVVAFYQCSSLTSVTIPNSVISIGGSAFYDCSSLTSVAIPNNVTSIGEKAFYYCSSLTSVTIGESVTSIGDRTFEGCSSLTSVTLPNSVTSIGTNAFSRCSKLTSVTIGESVTSIGSSAFYYCSSLTKTNYTGDITGWCNIKFGDGSANPMHCSHNFYINDQEIKDLVIPNSVTSIGNWAFEGCSSLISVTIPNSVTSIGIYAFEGCSSLTSVTIPESVTSIGYSAFYECSSLTSVTIPESVTSIGEWAFYNCSSLTSITIPESVTSIGVRTFSGCKSLTSVTIGESVTSIGNYAFEGCSSLTSVTIPESVTSIGYSAFKGCYSLTSVTIGDSVTSIGEYAFSYCSSLTSVTIGNSVTSIGNYAFEGCSSLTSVTIPESVTSIGEWAFYNCSSLTSITIPESVTSIGEYTFRGCSSLTSVTIPNSVTSIGAAAFYGCSSLTSVTIGESVTSIGRSAFAYCSSLTSVTCEAETPPTIGGTHTFDGVSTSIPVYVPCECVKAYKAASGWSDFTNIQEPLAEYSIEVYVNDTIMGTAKVNYNTFCEGNQISAIPNIGYHFVQWSDGNTDAIRTLELTQDTILTAEFAQSFSGQCGDSLYWEFADETLHITGSGKMYDYNSYNNFVPWTLLVTSIKFVTIGESVTSIDNNAFYDCSSLTSVTINSDAIVNKQYSQDSNLSHIFGSQVTEYVIGDNVIGIGDYAFYYCSSLTSVTIPNSITSIGEWAFSGCSSLTSVTIGESVTSIGNYAFYGCSSLTSITIPESVTSIGDEACYNCSSLTSITIPESVTSIGEWAFYNCSSLTKTNYTGNIAGWCNIMFGNNYANPMYYSHNFYINDQEIKDLVIPNNVTSIGSYAFNGCSSLTSITCEAATPPTVGSDAFYRVSKSIPVYVPCGCVEAYKAIYGWKYFTNIQEPLAEYSITVDVNDPIMGSAKVDKNTICDAAQFSATPNIGYHFVQWSDGVTDNPRTLELTQDTILIAEFAQSFSGQCGDSLYWELVDTTLHITGKGEMYDYKSDSAPWKLLVSSIKVLTIAEDVTMIGYDAFDGCIALVTIVWNAKHAADAYNDGQYNYPVFYGICSQITSFNLGENVEYIPSHLCSGMENLTSVTIPESVTSIGTCAFQDCSSLTSVTIGNSVTSIGDGAFKDCSSLTSVTTPNSLKTIGISAFEGCARLGKISLGTGLEEIAANAFAGCTRLYDIYVYATYPPFADESSFANYNVYVYIPCEYQRDYILDIVWGKFKFIECIDSEDVTTDGVVITPSTNDVTIIWPTETEANTYTIVIKKGNEVFCTLTFNADGQLLNITFAPGRDGNHPVQYAEQAVNGYRFTVTGLEEATHYAYNIDVKDAADKTIATYSGEFTTMGGTTTEMDNTQSPTSDCQKILYEDHIYILRDGKIYSIMGQEM